MKIDKPSSSSFSGEKKKDSKEQNQHSNSSNKDNQNKEQNSTEFATILEEKKKEQVIKDIFKLINKRGVEDEQEFTEFSRANGYDKKTYNECRTIYEGFGQRDRGNQEEKRRSGSLSKGTQEEELTIESYLRSRNKISQSMRDRHNGDRRDDAKTKEPNYELLKAYQDMQEFLDKDLNLSKTSSNLEKKNTLNNNTSNTNQLSNKDNITNNQTNNKDNPNQTINPSIKELSNTTNQNKDNPTKENKSIIKKSFKKDKSNNKDKGL